MKFGRVIVEIKTMFEAGKYYRTRYGHVAFVKDIGGSAIIGAVYLPPVGMRLVYWSLSGTIQDSPDDPHDLDLVDGSQFDPVAELVKVEGELKELKESLEG